MPALDKVIRCRVCVLPSTFPGVGLNAEGVCRFCREYERQTPATDELTRKLGEAVASRRRDAQFDCILAFSGGKDSTYTLWRLSNELGLRCLPVMIDNGHLSETAVENAHRVTKRLDCELHIVRPDSEFLRELFRVSDADGVHSAAALRRASAICNSCIGVINDEVIREAVRQGVTLIAGGYLAGQVPNGAVAVRVNVDSHLRFEELRRNRLRSVMSEAATLAMPSKWTAGETQGNITIINPMLVWNPREEQILECIGQLGWKRPHDTGEASSNCRLNDVGIARHLAQHQFHPYVFEWATQVRQGLMEREEALRRLDPGKMPN